MSWRIGGAGGVRAWRGPGVRGRGPRREPAVLEDLVDDVALAGVDEADDFNTPRMNTMTTPMVTSAPNQLS
ncbi:MAG: hypothetical protein ACYTFF_15790 [Planctomycetota bacterium]